MNFSVPTQNRFEILQGREESSSKLTMDNMNISRQDFIHSSMDNKLTYMFDELRVIRNEQVNCNRGLQMFEKTISGIDKTLGQVIQVTNTQTDFMKSLAYKSIDIEARSRRNNLIFRGFSENRGENCFQLIRDFLSNHLDMDPRDLYLARAHRLGRPDTTKQFQRRPIIVLFRDYDDIETIMGRVKMLKGTSFSIDFDFPKEIADARRSFK